MKLLKPLLALMLLTGCGGFRASKSALHFRFVNSESVELIPPSDKVDVSCRQNSEYDSCIYMKNPVASVGAVVANDDDLRARQTFGIRITDTDQSGYLQNSDIQVLAMTGPRVFLFDDNQRKSLYSSDNNLVEQTMAYYWLTRSTAFLQNRLGQLPAKDQKLKVYLGAPHTGWSARTNAIHLSGSKHAGLNADVLLSLWGEANAHYASQGAIADFTGDASHVACSNDIKGCCSSKSGCSKALLSGVGDYFALMVFANQPRIGEGLANSVSGQSLCGKTRDVADFANLKAADIYSACSSKGWAPAMGFLYASIWWEVRKKAIDPEKLDQLFLRHLMDLTGHDTFVTAKAKILGLAPIYGADLKALFQQEFSSRQL